MEFNCSDEWLRKMAEAEDGCIIGVGVIDENCPFCTTPVNETTEEYELQYGQPGDKLYAILKVSHPVLSCPKCGESWFDWRGEVARSKAVEEHLKSFNSV